MKNESDKLIRKRVARSVFFIGAVLAVITFRLGLTSASYLLYVIAFPSWLILFASPGYPNFSGFEYFAVFTFASWLNGHIIGWIVWRFTATRRRRMPQSSSPNIPDKSQK
jgi:hypothetical protein